jgi:hypothetical protein
MYGKQSQTAQGVLMASQQTVAAREPLWQIAPYDQCTVRGSDADRRPGGGLEHNSFLSADIIHNKLWGVNT